MRCLLCGYDGLTTAPGPCERESDDGGAGFLHCAGCDLIARDPARRLSREAEESRYRQHDNDGDPAGHRAFLGRLVDPLVIRLVQRTMHPSFGANDKLKGLDYGSGPRPVLAMMLKEKGFSCDVYDPLFQPDPAKLERSYDFITCTEVVEHFHEPLAEFNRLFGLLKEDGELAVMTQLRPAEGFERWWYARDPTHMSFYSGKTMAWIAGRFGRRLTLMPQGIAFFGL